ncbi:hypothetical protein [Methanobrevibacter sp.]|uniref:hypothetical protein n=1 Tax=Methanobrevibacter sp. TaxID=66852 RepID=UPI00388E813E
MPFEFSFVGLLFLIMLFVPNIAWSRNLPKDYEKFSKNENRILLVLERIGQVLVTVFSLFSGAVFSLNILFLVSLLLMIVYELYWLRYMRGSKTMERMYANFLMIPLPGATLPVCAFILLGIYSNNIFLTVSSIILGIGHIGIHLMHFKEMKY